MRKNSRIIGFLALTAVLGLVMFSLVLVSSPNPIVIKLHSYTNCAAVVSITNRGSQPLDYVVLCERKIGGKWPNGALGQSIPQGQFGRLSPGQVTNLSIPVMVYVPPERWRITAFCNRPVVSVTRSPPRLKAAIWAHKLGMRKLSAMLLGGGSKEIQISTSEMEQWEK